MIKSAIVLLLISATFIYAAPKYEVSLKTKWGILDLLKPLNSLLKPANTFLNPSTFFSRLPKLTNIIVLPAGPWRRGPYRGQCSCLSNLGGCYIDAGNPPNIGFTCKCVKAEGWITGKNYACVAFDYKLARHEKHTGGTSDLKQCRNGLKSRGTFRGDCGGYIENFDDDTWKEVENRVNLKLFAPHTQTGSGECEIWSKGKDIDCTLIGEESKIYLPSGFNRDYPVKGIIHGFADDSRFRTRAVSEYNKKFGGKVNVIMFDWPKLSKGLDIEQDTFKNWGYLRGARNVPIVGEYIGRCLAGIAKETGLKSSDIHIAGHSLGGQMLGRIGRAYERYTGEKIGRLTGLDPAGPAFVDGVHGDLKADHWLYEERLHMDDATFVDVIHTSAAERGPALLNLGNPLKMRLGDYGPNGHYDFYVDGGEEQRGCNPGNAKELCRIGCSHERAFQYFFDSINDCKFYQFHDGNKICMGEQAAENWWQEKNMYGSQTKLDLEVNSKAWYRETSLEQDCKNTAKFACRVLFNIPTYTIFDSGICASDYSLLDC